MVSFSWWLPATIAPLALQMCAVPLYSYWVSFAKATAFDSTETPASAHFSYSQIKSSTTLLAACLFSTLVISANSNATRALSVDNASLCGVALVTVALILFNSTVRRGHAPRNVVGIEYVNFLLFCAAAAFLLLVSSNLLTAFFALELLGAVTLYAFFVFGGYAAQGSQQRSLAVVNSCVYQFVLNFFGSVLFYAALGATAYYHSSSSAHGASARMAFGYPSAAQTAAIGALMIKMGTGPWVFYKLSIYKGITVHAVAVYTFIYFGAVLVFTLGLITRSGLEISSWFGAASVSVLGLSAVAFGGSAFQTGTITLFLSFSSMLNLIFLMLQIAQ